MISPEIICAPATPEGTSALAVIRVSGEGSFDLVEKIMSLKSGRLKGMKRKLGLIRENEKIIDEVVAISWPGGRSYTGEEMVEIICHGVPEIVAGILVLLRKNGARDAERGEFTRRAFISGKVSAIQIMALASIWNREEKLDVCYGKIASDCEELIKSIEKAMELLEGDIEFGELHFTTKKSQLSGELETLLDTAKEFARNATTLELRRKVLIMGPINSGKSTLFNVLTGEEKALVSDIPGTTRDGSRKTIELGGRKLILCDTAGTDGAGLDLIASQKEIDEIENGDRIVWMSICGKDEPPDMIRKRSPDILEVASKSDLASDADNIEMLKLSSITGEGITEVKEWISSSPGSRSLEGTVDRIVDDIIEAMKYVSEKEFGIAVEHLNEAEREARNIIEKGENLTLSVERALSSMCVGK